MMSAFEARAADSVHSDVGARAGRRLCVPLAAMAMLIVAGCGSLPTVPQAPQLELISSQPLALAADCQAEGTFRVEFAVRADGQVDSVSAAPAPSCVQDGLRAWVQSFRYAPTGTAAPIPHAVEWLMVSAPRG